MSSPTNTSRSFCRLELSPPSFICDYVQLDSHAPEAVVNPAKLLLDMSSFSLGIRDFHYEDDKGLLFVGISDMNVASRVDSYLTNMKLPWEKDLKTTVVTVGAVECYLCTSKTELRFDRSWSRTFPSQLICIYWDQSSCSLGVGLDSGQIDVLKVSAELNYIKHNQVLSAKIHAARVMGIYIEYITGYLYSIGEDKRLKVTDIMKNEIVADVAVGNTALAVMVVEKETKRAFIGNRDGAVYIYDINPCPPRLIHSIQVTPKGSIRALDFDNAKNYLFACCYEDGNIFIHDLERPGKERFAKYLANLPGKQKVRFVKWTNSRNEIYACNDDGTVTVWNRGAPIYVLQSNADAVTKVQYVEGKNILLAGGKDRKLKFWQLPDQWRDKTVEEEEEKEAQIRKDTINMLNLQNRQAAKKGDDSDEDDLAGWHKMK
eukprot:TRINITY_DN1907_c0_g2_i1.p1 TRINITY_DN1907_c0_g2~~TRINITY_DN1907_c0_g2_i1.p1  ORF type:complete len:431 (-),score=134.84 TRINITY_DN1907_c0_g2_i1:297-1589(-)